AVVRRNLTRILPGTPPRALDELVGAVFRNFAVCFADLITANRRAGVGALVAAIDGMAELQKATRDGRGLVVLTAHLGNWGSPAGCWRATVRALRTSSSPPRPIPPSSASCAAASRR